MVDVSRGNEGKEATARITMGLTVRRESILSPCIMGPVRTSVKKRTKSCLLEKAVMGELYDSLGRNNPERERIKTTK